MAAASSSPLPHDVNGDSSANETSHVLAPSDGMPLHGAAASVGVSGAAAAATAATTTTANNRSVSTVSVSSEGSNGSHMVDQTDFPALIQEVKAFSEALRHLKGVFVELPDEPWEIQRVACHERLSEMLRILRNMLERYPPLQNNDLVNSAGLLINQVKDYNRQEDLIDEREFHQALNWLAISFSNGVSEYWTTGDSENSSTASSSAVGGGGHHIKLTSSHATQLEGMAMAIRAEATQALREDGTSVEYEDTDEVLMRQNKGVDQALKYLKNWEKYTKDVINYVEKRTSLEQELTRNLAKLAQTTRQVLRTESSLPFQSVYCTALDQDVEYCKNTQTACAQLQSYKFMEPMSLKRAENQKARKAVKDRWSKELKNNYDKVSSLNKAKSVYYERHKEYDRCREAVKIAEQGAEIGATGDNKVDKRKRLEEEALIKLRESEETYRRLIREANDSKAQLDNVKAEVLQQIRELILSCDETVKEVTVQYFKHQHSLSAPLPIQFQKLCERSNEYELGCQYKEYVRTRVGDLDGERYSSPFHFEVYQPNDQLMYIEGGASSDGRYHNRRASDVDDFTSSSGIYRFRGDYRSVSSSAPSGTTGHGSGGPMVAWPPSMGPIEGSDDSDSEGSQESVKSRNTSPSHSPMVHSRQTAHHEGDEDEGDHGGHETRGASAYDGRSDKHVRLTLAAKTHNFRKLNTPSKCRDCNSYVFPGVNCADCGVSCHKRCLATLALTCGAKKLSKKPVCFGIELGQHLLDFGAQVPPVVSKCIHRVDSVGLQVKGIYRVSGVKHKIDRLTCQFDTAPEFVDLHDVQPHVVSSLLKAYFRELPDPLIPFNHYGEFCRVGRIALADPESSVVGELYEVCHRLLTHHLRTLALLMHHLKRVQSESSVNQMTASNLSIVFAPSLMRSRPTATDSNSLSTLVENTEVINKVVEMLILHADELFGPPETVIPRDYAKYTRKPVIHAEGSSGGRKEKRQKTRREGFITSSASIGGAGGGVDLISSQTERRTVVDTHAEDFQGLPGIVGDREGNDEFNLSDEDDAEAIPACWLPDDSSKTKKSPLLTRTNSPPPQIIKASLKGFTGLENVTLEKLSTQDSLESAQRLSKQASAEIVPLASGAAPSSRRSIPHDASGSGGGMARQHRPSETLFSKVGKAAKKHSLDEEYLSPPPSATGHPLLSERLSGDPISPTQKTSGASLPAFSLNSGHPHQSPAGSCSSSSSSTTLRADAGRRSTTSTTISSPSTADPPPPPVTTPNQEEPVKESVMRSSTSPGSGRASLTIGIGAASSSSSTASSSGLGHPGRSSSLSDDHHASVLSVAEQKRKFLASASTDHAPPQSHHHFGGQHSKAGSTSSSLSSSSGGAAAQAGATTTIANLEENRVKIQVTTGSIKHVPVVKQTSVDKEEP